MRAPVAVLVASLAAAPVSWPATVEGSPQLRPSPSREPGPTVPDLPSRTPGVAPASWDTFSADLTIRRHLVRRDGQVGLQGPEMRYRWTRTLSDTGWKTTMTVLSVSPETVQTSKGPQVLSRKVPVSRIEIGDERTPARVFDTEGRMIFMLPTAPAAPAPLAGERSLPDALEQVRTAAANFKSSLAPDATAAAARTPADPRSREWIEQLMPSATGRAHRHAALARDMGAVQGDVRGLDRFVRTSENTTTEVLSDPTWSVPVEINVVRGGNLVSHSVLSYDTDPGAGLVRRRILTEQLLSPESGDRAVVDFELSNIRLGRGAVR